MKICQQLVPSANCEHFLANACNCKVYCNSNLKFLSSYFLEVQNMQEAISQRMAQQMPASSQSLNGLPQMVMKSMQNSYMQKRQLVRIVEDLLKVKD